MVVDPGTALLITAAVGAAAKGTGDYLSNQQSKKAAKLRSKEMKRETMADLFQNALQRSAELESQRLQSSNQLGKRRSQSLQESADLIRGAFNV